MRLISEVDRQLVAQRVTRMKQLIRSGAYASMTHGEAYDAVYGTEKHPDHKQDRLENIRRITG